MTVARDGAADRLLALLLSRGTWLASGLIALGLVLPPPTASRLVAAGIALMILLPVLRLLLMLVLFTRARDHRFAAISALVLAIILLAALLGARAASL